MQVQLGLLFAPWGHAYPSFGLHIYGGKIAIRKRDGYRKLRAGFSLQKALEKEETRGPKDRTSTSILQMMISRIPSHWALESGCRMPV